MTWWPLGSFTKFWFLLVEFFFVFVNNNGVPTSPNSLFLHYVLFSFPSLNPYHYYSNYPIISSFNLIFPFTNMTFSERAGIEFQEVSCLDLVMFFQVFTKAKTPAKFPFILSYQKHFALYIDEPKQAICTTGQFKAQERREASRSEWKMLSWFQQDCFERAENEGPPPG